MTSRAVERMTGYEVRKAVATEHRKVAYAAFLGPDQLFWAEDWTPSGALKTLHAKIYKAHALGVFEAQAWACKECGRIKTLDAHHVKARSKGRDDRAENLVGLCRECHGNRHGKSGR